MANLRRGTSPHPRSPIRLLARAVFVFALGGASIAATMGLTWNVASQSGRAISTSPSEPILLKPLATRSIIYDAGGNEMALLYAEQDRQEVPLESVPELVQTTILTSEDADFYSHKGVNVRSLIRALHSDIDSGQVAQGGSTITQQLIKQSITGDRQTLERKVREAILATKLEKQMSKEEILERYLNTVYLGHGAYGVEAASETYFNKSVTDIGWAEAAMLASLIPNPTRYDPISTETRDRSKTQRGIVVRRLVQEQVIDQAAADKINDTPLPTQVFEREKATAQAQLVGGSYFSETVKQVLLDLPELGATAQDRYDAVFTGGLRVYTTYEPAAQQAAEAATLKVPDSGGKYFVGVAAVDPKNGAVRAMVGGPDFETSKVNYVTQGWRQPGSSFKYFVLMAAIEAGYVPNDTISGASPCKFPDPTAKDGVYVATGGGKTTTITGQTQVSSNCGFLRLGQTVGLDRVADMANRMGMSTIESYTGEDGSTGLRETPIPSDILSLPLGSKEVHPVNMAAAYATAANDGIYNPPYYVDKVTDAKGKVLYQHQSEGTRVVSVETARLVTQVLAKNVTGGTGRKSALKEQESAGKTGTTQENADTWFVGYTPYLSTAVWLGSPTGRDKIVIKGRAVMGGDYTAQVWQAFNEPYHALLPSIDFEPPEPTRKGKAIRYTNKVDRGGTTKKPTTTTTVPQGFPPGFPPAAPQTSPPATTPPTTPAGDGGTATGGN